MRKAAFSISLPEQILALKNKGFVLIRRAEAQSLTDLANLNENVLSYSNSKIMSFKYQLWRFFNSVSTSRKRHSIPIPMHMNMLRTVLSDSLGSVRNVIDSQVSACSPLVELSTIISFPDSTQQAIHSDTSYSDSTLIISGFIALSSVSLENGPTSLYSGSHTKQFHRHHAKVAPMNTYYSPDGGLEVNEEKVDRTDTNDVSCDLATAAAQKLPEYAEMRTGDILLFDTKLFHFGTANTSDIPRAFVVFAFQQRNTVGKAERVEGFTYHCHSSTQNNRFSLSDFPPTVRPECISFADMNR